MSLHSSSRFFRPSLIVLSACLIISMAASCATVYKSQRNLVDILAWPSFATSVSDADAEAARYCLNSGYDQGEPGRIIWMDEPGVIEYVLFPIYTFQGEIYTYDCSHAKQ